MIGRTDHGGCAVRLKRKQVEVIWQAFTEDPDMREVDVTPSADGKVRARRVITTESLKPLPFTGNRKNSSDEID